MLWKNKKTVGENMIIDFTSQKVTTFQNLEGLCKLLAQPVIITHMHQNQISAPNSGMCARNHFFS